MKHKFRIFFAVALFVLLAAGMEWLCRYHFFAIEQYRLFLFTGDYFFDTLAEPGGLALWVAEFFVQFFAVPYMGAILTALLLTGVGTFTMLISEKTAPGTSLWVLWILPVSGLLCVSFNPNYSYQGTVALLGMAAALWACIRIPRFGVRLAIGAVSVPLLFWFCGSVAVLYVVCIVLWEALNGTPRWYISLALTAELALVAWGAIRFGFIGDTVQALTPMLYFNHLLKASEPSFWFAWAGLPVAIAGARLCRRLKTNSLLSVSVLTAVQCAVVACLVWKVVIPRTAPESYELKRLAHYARTGRWDAIIERSRGTADNYIRLNYLNLALAEKGILADELFKYDQRGTNGLVLPWDMSLPTAVLRSDIYFRIGSIAGAQHMAFEGNVATPGRGNPGMLQRLVQTNLIYGAYPVAEKYLDILSATLFYRDWAEDHRRFLYNDREVEEDALLGEKRACLPDESRFFKTIYGDLELVARQNSASETAIEYLGSLALLAKDTKFFRAMIEIYYGTEILPFLPRSFQEAVVSIYENSPTMWEHYGVDGRVVERYAAFRQRLQDNGGKSGLVNLMRGSYGDTYWFYQTFK